jgi:hypothetical protein
MVTLNTDEPEATIYSPEWRTAQSRLRHLRVPELTKILRSVFRHFEDGWHTIRPIQAYHEEDPRRTDLDPKTAAVLYFLEVEVVDRYRELALEMIRAVPMTRRAKVSTASFDDVQAETELLQHYFRLAGIMGRSAEVAEPVRSFAASAGTLDVWAVEFARIFSEVDAAIKALGLDADEEEDGGSEDE